ncbi:MAG: nucleotidyltransferase family protein [Pseudomonadota bacterium]
MNKVTAVVLAAGLSRRMGQRNKMLLPIAGEAMMLRTLRAYLGVFDDVLIVTGFEADKIGAAVAHLNLRIVHNPDYEDGQASSVAVGLRAAPNADHVVIGLGDQPLLRRGELELLVKTHLSRGGTKITVPHNGTSRGNPIVVPGRLLPEILEDKQNPGCGMFTRTRPDLVDFVSLPNQGFFYDVDTPDEYAELEAETHFAC